MTGAFGLQFGIQFGTQFGVNFAGSTTPVIPGVTRDATSGIYAPATASEWTTFLAAFQVATGISVANPTVAWNFQDAAGNPTDFMGGSVVLGVNAGPTYQSPSTGWSRVGIRFTDGAASQRMFNNSGAPDPSATSTLVLCYIDFPAAAPVAARGVVTKTATTPRVAHNTTNKLQVVDGATADMANPIGSGVKPLWLQTDIPNTLSKVYSDTEEFIGTYALPAAGAFIGFAGTTPAVAGNHNYLYACEFTGTAAQLTKAQIRSLTQFLGWTVTF
jgi:hypothetical protein